MTSQNMIHDTATVLENGAAARTATGIGSTAALDLGGGGELAPGAKLPIGAAVEVDVTNIDTTDTNETYEVQVQVATDAAFTAAIEVGSRVVAAAGKYVIPVTNEVNGNRYRYMRCRHVLAGTTPSITYQAGLSVR